MADLLPTKTESNSQLILWRMSVLLWAAFIFYLSTATFGHATSQSLLTGAVAFLHVTLSRAAFDTVHEVCRKLGHLAEYGIFSLLLYRSLPTPEGGERQRALWSVLAAAAYSLTDESHQLFVPGRHASIVDCAIDSTGAALAVLLALGYSSCREHKAVAHAAGRHPDTVKMTPHPPSYLGHPLPRGPRGEGGESREGGEPGEGFFKAGDLDLK